MGWSYPPDGREFQGAGAVKEGLGAYSHPLDLFQQGGLICDRDLVYQ
jgi:hypothetical protein